MKALGPFKEIPCESGIGIQRKSALDRIKAGSALAGQNQYSPAAHPQRIWVFVSRLDRLACETHAFGDFLIGDRGQVPDLEDATPREQTCCWGTGGVDRQRTTQQRNRLPPAFSGPLPELSKSAQV
jgi:hypothetical protein